MWCCRMVDTTQVVYQFNAEISSPTAAVIFVCGSSASLSPSLSSVAFQYTGMYQLDAAGGGGCRSGNPSNNHSCACDEGSLVVNTVGKFCG